MRFLIQESQLEFIACGPTERTKPNGRYDSCWWFSTRSPSKTASFTGPGTIESITSFSIPMQILTMRRAAFSSLTSAGWWLKSIRMWRKPARRSTFQIWKPIRSWGSSETTGRSLCRFAVSCCRPSFQRSTGANRGRTLGFSRLVSVMPSSSTSLGAWTQWRTFGAISRTTNQSHRLKIFPSRFSRLVKVRWLSIASKI